MALVFTSGLGSREPRRKRSGVGILSDLNSYCELDKMGVERELVTPRLLSELVDAGEVAEGSPRVTPAG